MDDLTSAAGSLGVAIAALLLVLGYRLARPSRGREWLALVAYGAALVVQVAGAHGLLPGAIAAGPVVRMGGAVLLVAGLVVAGKPARSRRAAAVRAGEPPTLAPRGLGPAYMGLAIVLLGQLARTPSVSGAVATLAAVAVCLVAARSGV